MTWSGQQEQALASVSAWLSDRAAPQVFRLFGYAGTGKTTLAREISGLLKGKVLYGAFTGKAALVMRGKGCQAASTIHSMIYSVEQDEVTGLAIFTLNHASPVGDAKLVIIDECSMVDEDLGRDLLSFGTRVLVLGDPAQLPPVKGAGFFTAAAPDVMLTEIHRQARDNPIIAMATDVREGRRLERELGLSDRRRFDEFDFGYVLTVHKAQGSQWNSVLIFDESGVFREDSRRHLYTAITRAAERVMVIQ